MELRARRETLDRIAALALAAALAACGLDPADPVDVTKAFLSAASAGDCDRAWSHYSAGTQKNIRDEMRRIQRESEDPSPPVRPEERYCQGSYGSLVRGSARLASANDSDAVVAVTFSEGTHLALIPFLSTPYKEYPGELRLVKEDGRWKIERPRARIGREGWKLVEVGPVDVAYSLRGDPNRRRVEARAPLKVSRAALQQVLTQPESWARMLPEASHVEVVDTADGLQRLRLRFEGWDQPVTIEAKPYGNLVNEKLPWATLQWRSDEKAPRPVLFTGSWNLRPRTDGTWVTFGFVIEPRQWPEGMAERILSADRVAASILALEKLATQAR